MNNLPEVIQDVIPDETNVSKNEKLAQDIIDEMYYLAKLSEDIDFKVNVYKTLLPYLTPNAHQRITQENKIKGNTGGVQQELLPTNNIYTSFNNLRRRKQ